MYKDRSRKSNSLEKSLIDFYTVYFVFSLAIVNAYLSSASAAVSEAEVPLSIT